MFQIVLPSLAGQERMVPPHRTTMPPLELDLPTPCVGPAHRRNVLLVDDEPGIRRSVGRFLRRYGFEVTDVPSVEAAMQELEQGRFDLIVTDLRMPGLSGEEFYGFLRRDHPGDAPPGHLHQWRYAPGGDPPVPGPVRLPGAGEAVRTARTGQCSRLPVPAAGAFRPAGHGLTRGMVPATSLTPFRCHSSTRPRPPQRQITWCWRCCQSPCWYSTRWASCVTPIPPRSGSSPDLGRRIRGGSVDRLLTVLRERDGRNLAGWLRERRGRDIERLPGMPWPPRRRHRVQLRRDRAHSWAAPVPPAGGCSRWTMRASASSRACSAASPPRWRRLLPWPAGSPTTSTTRWPPSAEASRPPGCESSPRIGCRPENSWTPRRRPVPRPDWCGACSTSPARLRDSAGPWTLAW